MSDLLERAGAGLVSVSAPTEIIPNQPTMSDAGEFLNDLRPPEERPTNPEGSISLVSQARTVEHALLFWSSDDERISGVRIKAHEVAQLSILASGERASPGRSILGLNGLPISGIGTEIFTVFSVEELPLVRSALVAEASRQHSVDADLPGLFTHHGNKLTPAEAFFKDSAHMLLERAFPADV